MRIRRRPPFPSSLHSDPFAPLLPPPNGTRDGPKERVEGKREGLLHPDVNSQALEEDSIKRDHTIVGKSSSTPNPTQVQVLEEEMVDSSRRWDAAGEVNSNKRLEVSDSKRKLEYSKKSCTSSNGATVDEDTNKQGRKRKRINAAALMEGSRCSRVNGRGWRCCQKTLVGYSLCEHHLGKGRLRSMTSVRGQLGSNNLKRRAPRREEEEEKEEIIEETKEEADDDDDEEKTRAKRKSIGMVKARSISSLLDEMKDNSGSSNASLESPVLPAAALNGSEAIV